MISSRVFLSEDDICETYTTIRSDLGMGVSVEEADGDEEGAERAALLKEIDKCVGSINSLLTDAGFEIKLAIMEKGARFYVFVNTQADTLAKNFGSKLTVEEMGFYRAGVEAIINVGIDEIEISEDLDEGEKENEGVGGMGCKGKLTTSNFIGLRTTPAALVDVPTVGIGGDEDNEEGGRGGRSSIVKGKAISAKRAEKLLEIFVQDGWLGRSNRDNLVLGVRTYAELPDLCRSFGLSSLPQMVTLR